MPAPKGHAALGGAAVGLGAAEAGWLRERLMAMDARPSERPLAYFRA